MVYLAENALLACASSSCSHSTKPGWPFHSVLVALGLKLDCTRMAAFLATGAASSTCSTMGWRWRFSTLKRCSMLRSLRPCIKPAVSVSSLTGSVRTTMRSSRPKDRPRRSKSLDCGSNRVWPTLAWSRSRAMGPAGQSPDSLGNWATSQAWGSRMGVVRATSTAGTCSALSDKVTRSPPEGMLTFCGRANSVA